MVLLNVRNKEVETIQTIIYHEDLDPEVQRVIDIDAEANACILANTFSMIYELDILPENPESLGRSLSCLYCKNSSQKTTQ